MIVASLILSVMIRLENKTISGLIQYLEVAQNNFMDYIEEVLQQLSCFIEYVKRVYESWEYDKYFFHNSSLCCPTNVRFYFKQSEA